jgi:hypothetical protein
MPLGQCSNPGWQHLSSGITTAFPRCSFCSSGTAELRLPLQKRHTLPLSALPAVYRRAKPTYRRKIEPCQSDHWQQSGRGGKGEGSAMNDMLISTDSGADRTFDRAREADGLVAAGSQKLQQLHSLLDKPWFCDRHTVRFELETMGKDLSLHIVRPGDQVIASWTARGDALVFSTAGGTEIRAEIIDCAVSITCEFLDQARGRRN